MPTSALFDEWRVYSRARARERKEACTQGGMHARRHACKEACVQGGMHARRHARMCPCIRKAPTNKTESYSAIRTRSSCEAMVVEPITCIKPADPMISTRLSGGVAEGSHRMQCTVLCRPTRYRLLCTDGGTYSRPVEWDSALDVLLQKQAWSRLSNYWQRASKGDPPGARFGSDLRPPATM